MKLLKWSGLPTYMKTKEVKQYYLLLRKRKGSLAVKRVIDVLLSLLLLIALSPCMLILMALIKLDSRGPVFFRQERVTQYGRIFRIYKFRSMVNNAEKMGTQVTVCEDKRITRVGCMMRKLRLDEIPQLINILNGDMTFVGTRPEVKKYVDSYTKEMYATLLLPAGLTSRTSIQYKDEEKLLENVEDVDRAYVELVLPQKMKYNLQYVKKFSLFSDIITMLATLAAVIK